MWGVLTPLASPFDIMDKDPRPVVATTSFHGLARNDSLDRGGSLRWLLERRAIGAASNYIHTEDVVPIREDKGAPSLVLCCDGQK